MRGFRDSAETKAQSLIWHRSSNDPGMSSKRKSSQGSVADRTESGLRSLRSDEPNNEDSGSEREREMDRERDRDDERHREIRRAEEVRQKTQTQREKREAEGAQRAQENQKQAPLRHAESRSAPEQRRHGRPRKREECAGGLTLLRRARRFDNTRVMPAGKKGQSPLAAQSTTVQPLSGEQRLEPQWGPLSW